MSIKDRVTKALRAVFPSRAAPAARQADTPETTVPRDEAHAADREQDSGVEVKVKVSGMFGYRSLVARVRNEHGNTSVISVPLNKSLSFRSVPGMGNYRVLAGHQVLFETASATLVNAFLKAAGDALVGGSLRGAGKFAMGLAGLFVVVSLIGGMAAKKSSQYAYAAPASFQGFMPPQPPNGEVPGGGVIGQFPHFPPNIPGAPVRDAAVAAASADLSKFGLGQARSNVGAAASAAGAKGGGAGGNILDVKNPVIAQCPSPGGK